MGTKTDRGVRSLAGTVVAAVRADELRLGPAPTRWASGVYCLLDAVFRARADYETIVRPMLAERLAARPGMRDRATLRFRDLLDDVRGMRGDKHEAYAEVALNRQQLAHRLKVSICCDAAELLSRRKLETRRRLLALEPLELEALACDELTRIRGFGGVLARHWLAALGFEHAVRPDRDLRRFLERVTGWRPRAGDEDDDARARAVIEAAAKRLRVAPLHVDAAIRRAEAAP